MQTAHILELRRQGARFRLFHLDQFGKFFMLGHECLLNDEEWRLAKLMKPRIVSR
jgi:hypothetical protein